MELMNNHSTINILLLRLPILLGKVYVEIQV